MFEPFFTTRPGGTGLGLAIAKTIVEGLGGTIAVASVPGRGTEFRIDLPRAGPRGLLTPMTPELGSILLVDDEEKILKALGRALRDAGHEVTVTARAARGAAAARRPRRSTCSSSTT